jgi:hypothetical protein
MKLACQCGRVSLVASHRCDVIAGRVCLVVPEHGVNPRHARVIGRLVDQPI